MRHSSIIFLIACVLIANLPLAAQNGSGINQPSRAIKKRALLVGISNYCRTANKNECSNSNSEGKEWWDLNGTHNDVDTLAEVLVRRYGFEVKILKTNAETTKANITKAFQDFLITPTAKGDVVYFHFSGHGVQSPDDGDAGDNEPDGMDETIIPSDYISREDTSKNIRDDEIAVWLAKLDEKKPANFTFTVDSCFSGTLPRGGQVPRGGEYTGKIPANLASKRGDTNADDEGSGFARGTEKPNYVFLSAASPRQVAWEEYNSKLKKYQGVFTFALVDTLENHIGSETSYRDLFKRVNAFIAANRVGQSPQIEGRIDTKVLNGAALRRDLLIDVVPGKNGKPYLKAGNLVGMTVNSKFNIYPAETKRVGKSTPLAQATIVEVSGRESRLEFADGKILTLDKAAPLQAIEIEHANDFSLLKIKIQNVDALDGGKEATTAMQKYTLGESVAAASEDFNILIRPANAADVQNEIARINERETMQIAPEEEIEFRQTLNAEWRGVVMQRKNESIIALVPAGKKLGDDIKNKLKDELRFQTVLDLENTDTDLLIETRLFKPNGTIKETIQGRQFTESAESKKTNDAAWKSIETVARGADKFNLGQNVRFDVRNPNDFPIYVTILMLSDNKVQAFYPEAEALTPNNIIAPNGIMTQYFQAAPPLGTEVFKILATREPTDFSLLVTNTGTGGERGERRAAAKSNLGKLFDALNKADGVNGKGAIRFSNQPEMWASETVVYTIVK